MIGLRQPKILVACYVFSCYLFLTSIKTLSLQWQVDWVHPKDMAPVKPPRTTKAKA